MAMRPPASTPDRHARLALAATVLATAVVFVLESGFVTGETIRVDGGRHVR